MTLPVIVLGSGLGGLAAAIRLRAMGWPVRVLEAMDQPGGRAATFVQDGFSFDAGPTVVTASYLFDELFALVGRDRREHLEFLPVDPFYRVFFADGASFDYVGDEDRLLAQIAALSPADVDGYRRLAAHARRIFDIGYTELVDQPFDRFTDMVKIVPDLVRLGCWKSVYAWVSQYIADERLRQVFTFQPLLIGGNPFRAPAIYALIHWLERKWGVEFARGGTASIVRAMVDLIHAIGGHVQLSTPVTEIEVEAGRAVAVRTGSGERIPCAAVVSNADPAYVYTRMVAARHRRWNSDFMVRQKKLSMGLFVGYFGARGRWPDLAHHSIVLGPRYRELLAEIFHGNALPDDFSLYLHYPTVTDPSLAPPGRGTFYVLAPVPHLGNADVDWDREAPAYGEKILASMESLMPDLRKHVTVRRYLTPRDFQRDLGTYRGSAFSCAPQLMQSAYFRPHNADRKIPGLYLVGAGTHPGAGVPGVVSGAKATASVIAKDFA